jgi:hypothetical protein
MRTSELTNEISAALAKAQGEITNPAKESQNPHFRASYADLASGINAIRAPLAKNGLAYSQATRLDGEVLMVDTRLSHVSGQWFESEFPACRFPAKPQEVGSALTYARRYALFSLVGIAGEDDDGEAANKSETPARVRNSKPEDASAKWSRETASMFIEALKMAKNIVDLSAWKEQNGETVRKLFPEDVKSVSSAYNVHFNKLTGEQ